MKVAEVISLIKRDGWYLARHKGTSHRKFRHAKKPGCVTISGNLGEDLAKGTLNSILKQAGLKGSK
jgi:predicted RNA binding protein YcfA (HicA-like mRNA interferase family)